MTMTRKAIGRVGGAAVAVLVLAAPVLVQAEDFDLDALIEAAKQEAPINIYDSTGKIVEMAENFSAKYGLKATGIKVSASSQLEMIIREGEAKGSDD